jgi:hypothetical protein
MLIVYIHCYKASKWVQLGKQNVQMFVFKMSKVSIVVNFPYLKDSNNLTSTAPRKLEEKNKRMNFVLNNEKQ